MSSVEGEWTAGLIPLPELMAAVALAVDLACVLEGIKRDTNAAVSDRVNKELIAGCIQTGDQCVEGSESVGPFLRLPEPLQRYHRANCHQR